ncbi:glycosyltransferase [Corynebacterium sp. Q4381]|uniref:glycosyltransferase n=1 Tax=Corynebacterium sp. Marseille-Q4381 TaxID=3121597 RepID=UPI002FE63BB0
MTTDQRAVRVLAIPAEHPYTQAVLPAGVEYVPDPDVDGEGRWWPHPALRADYWANPPQVDLVHIHFGFEHVSPDELRKTVAALPVPLVVTVHDIDNPHLADQREHHERLQVLVSAAAAVITLTDHAARMLRERFGAAGVRVLPHPQIAEPVDVPREPRAAVFVKSLRGNVVADPAFYTEIARNVPLGVYVHDVDATATLRRALADAPGGADLALHVHEPMSDAELHAAVARATVCVLPYTRGTHSGWLEMCRDQGTNVAVPDIGCYADQVDTPNAVEVYGVGDGAQASNASKTLLERGAVPLTTDRRAQLSQVRDAHAEIYRAVIDQTVRR